MVKTAKCHQEVSTNGYPGTGIQARVSRHGYQARVSSTGIQARVSRHGYPGTSIQARVSRNQYPGTSIQARVSRHGYPRHGYPRVRYPPLGSPWSSPNRSYVHVPSVPEPVVRPGCARAGGSRRCGRWGTGRVVYRGTTQSPAGMAYIGIARAQPLP